ncbi:MAG: sigma 54-interacting transcriptional regulator [Acidobacteriota bacterium]|nr:sigma 54-interacting transcriptional regulator [Acidobacteriota bacterium]
MPLVLVVQEDDRNLRFPLAPGEHHLGSQAASAPRLGHPTVSRSHARLLVEEDSLQVEDLGSSNGTFVDGRRIHEVTPVEPGQQLVFGTVKAWVEVVEDADLEAAVAIGEEPAVSAPSRASSAGGLDAGGGPIQRTVSMGSVKGFVFEGLPGVLDRLEQGAPVATVAQVLGEALFRTLPCREVVVLAEGGEPGILFEARRDPEEDGDESTARAVSVDGEGCPVEVRRSEIVLTVEFLHPAHARSYRSLVESAARLLGLGVRRRPKTPVLEPLSPPSPPDPPSVEQEMRQLYEDAVRVAAGEVSVLITGESGTGKELLARFVHRASGRREREFVALNCAALPEDLLESELFGIEKAVATGVDARPGKFELADGGSLFLDEIADMAPATQARILRVLQEREVYRLGGRQPRPARVRVLSATNRDLRGMVEEGSFRLDLYHRIADWTVELPALRQRRRDIPNLAAYFLDRAARRRGVRARGISRAALDQLLAYAWPGNVRQLERAMERAAIFLEDGELLQTRHLPEELRESVALGPAEAGDLRSRLEVHERRILEQAIAAEDGNLSAAARALGIGRSTLYRRLKELGIDAAAGEEAT